MKEVYRANGISKSKFSTSEKARAYARSRGELPHEFLCRIAQGYGIEHKQWQITYDENGKEVAREIVEATIYPSFETRVDAAKAAAPYYAPKLSMQRITAVTSNDISMVDLSQLSNDEVSRLMSLRNKDVDYPDEA